MKKIMFAVMAMCAIGFTACGNKTQAPADNAEAVEETMVYNAEEEAAASINQLTEQIEAQDASKFQEVLTAIQEKIKDIIGSDPAVAKEYVTKIQDFLNHYQGYQNLFSKYKLGDPKQDPKTKIVTVDISITPFFAAKNFVIKLEADNKDYMGAETSVEQ